MLKATNGRFLLGLALLPMLFVGCLGTEGVDDEQYAADEGPIEGANDEPPSEEDQASPIQKEHLSWEVGVCESLGALVGASGIDNDQVILEDEAKGRLFEASVSGQSGPHATFEVAFYDEQAQTVGHEASETFGTSLEGTVPEDAHWAIFYTCGATQVEATFIVPAP